MITLYTTTYILGCIASYMYNRNQIKKHEFYTKSDRLINIFFSGFSWIGLLASILATILLDVNEADW